MLLEALRSVGRAGGKNSHLASGRTEPSRALDPSGSGVEVRGGTKGASLLDCNVYPRKWGRRNEGPTAGGQHDERSSCAGSSAAESTSVFSSSFPLRGRASKKESRSAQWERGKSPVLRQLRADDHGVLEQLRRRGAFSHLVTRRSRARRGEVLRSRLLGPHNSSSSFQPAVGATVGGVVAAPASVVTKGGGLRRSNLSARLQRREEGGDGVDVARCPPTLERGWAVARRAPRKRLAGSEGERAGRRAPKGPCVHGGRGSDARGQCSRVDVVVCRSR